VTAYTLRAIVYVIAKESGALSCQRDLSYVRESSLISERALLCQRELSYVRESSTTHSTAIMSTDRTALLCRTSRMSIGMYV